MVNKKEYISHGKKKDACICTIPNEKCMLSDNAIEGTKSLLLTTKMKDRQILVFSTLRR